MRKLLLGFFLLQLALPSFAGGFSRGVVSYLFINSSGTGVLMFKIGADAPSTPATCSTAGQWAIPMDTSVGKGMMAILMSAQAQSLSVDVYGSGTCSAWGDREFPSAVVMTP